MKSHCAIISTRVTQNYDLKVALVRGRSDASSGSFVANRNGNELHIIAADPVHLQPEHQPNRARTQANTFDASALRFPASQEAIRGPAAVGEGWARGTFAVTSGTITDEMINEDISKWGAVSTRTMVNFPIDPS